MKRQQEDTEALVYAYGARIPLDDPHLQEELRKQRAFWDALVEATLAAERELDDRMKADSPQYAAAVQALIDASQAVREAIERRNAERAKTRSRTTSVDGEVKERITEKNAARKEVWRLAGEWRKANKEAVSEHQARMKEEAKRLRQGCGLYWGNYNRVLDSFQRARQQTLKKGRRVRPSDPARDDGILAVQIQRTKSGLGASPEELFSGNVSQLQIDRPPPGVEFLPANRRRREARVTARMRVDAAGHMIEFPVVLHRPVPPGARIKAAQLVWKREGERWRGQLCLTVSSPKQEREHPGVEACGIDLGWRLQKDGALRVATVADSKSRLYTYTLPADWMRGMDQVERLSSHLDENAMEVAAWVHAHRDELPEKLTQPAANWSPGKGSKWLRDKELHDAVRALNWEVPAEIRHWYERYRHLKTWRDNLRAKLLRSRREVYRLLAADLAGRYAVIGIEDMDLSKIAKTKKRKDASDPELHATARAQRQRAAVHALRHEIEHQANKHGAQLVHVSGKTTTTCRACGAATGQKDRASLIWTCEHCGAVWDQDLNAAGNILDSAMGASAPAATTLAKAKSRRYDLTQPNFRERSKTGSRASARA
ncbi:zinc ribbon domain-containing protein [Thioalkalivibrio thiocyanodenitrificans]|uniref:zinc ribbon domain-containing protein n=1 Tax=Thioalkalivibrio thiocyanodenitrificans TaxID=243063 RepID=UPI00036C0BEB|nr:zinc ribbon domain-containing protein [Thioalkalivibrio thiocyanodenitrificans]